MKGSSCTLAASVLAASTVALTSSSASSGDNNISFNPCSAEGYGAASSSAKNEAPRSDKEKFAPRFDGLRFIETLVTAHR